MGGAAGLLLVAMLKAPLCGVYGPGVALAGSPRWLVGGGVIVVGSGVSSSRGGLSWCLCLV